MPTQPFASAHAFSHSATVTRPIFARAPAPPTFTSAKLLHPPLPHQSTPAPIQAHSAAAPPEHHHHPLSLPRLFAPIGFSLAFLAGVVYQMVTDAPLASSPSSRLTSTWSNPTGEVLRRLEDNLWVAERPFIWNGIDVGGKMAVVRLSDGSLWVHSPVDLDNQLKAAVDALGPVRHILSPNFEHVKYAAQWRAAYPDATLYGCPGAKAKFPNIPYEAEVGVDNKVPAEWAADLAVTFIDVERNPFTGKPFFNEVVFHHKATNTLIVTDLFWNYPTTVPAATRLWKFGMDQVYLPFYSRLMVGDQSRFDQALRRIVGWQATGLLPCHGVYLAAGATETFTAHFGISGGGGGAVGQPGAKVTTLGGRVAQTVERLEMQRIKAQSVSTADGWKGEPKEWAAADSPTQKLSQLSQVGIFAKGKQWLAEQLAGDYDVQAIRDEMARFEGGVPAAMYSFSTCPFCLKAKTLLDEAGASYAVMELDLVPNGKAIRAELGKRTGRTSMPSMWVAGQYVGGCNDGGLGGVAPLMESGRLPQLLDAAGALRQANPYP